MGAGGAGRPAGDLQSSGYDLGATGFDAAEVDELFSKVHDKDVKDDDCDIDPEEIVPFVEPGDIWTLGRHCMVCGDATNAGDVALLMDGLKANLIVTDPPYNVAYQSADGKSIQNDSMADAAFYEFLLAAFRNMAAHLAEGGSAYIFHADTEGLNFRRAFKEAGFHISGVCIWVKNSLVLGRSPTSGSMSRCCLDGCQRQAQVVCRPQERQRFGTLISPSTPRSIPR